MGGGKGGGGGHTPYEAPDSLKSAQKLRAIGLISLGPIKGTVNKWKSTYFDNTPIQNADGVDDNDVDSFNFKNTEIQFTLGTQDQLPLKGFEASEREVPVNAEVKHAHPLTKTVIDPDVSRLRLTLAVNALFSQNEQGDTYGTSVVFEVLINNRSHRVYTIEGKSSSRFYRSYIINDLPPVPFTVTVKRVTEDSKSQRLQNATSWASYTEIIDTKLSYPNMALVGLKTDSRYNPNFPNVNFLLQGRLVKIPSNYDPVTRTYAAGIWKGDFKFEWTNNPAWIFYDLVTNKQIGLGERLGAFGVDKFQLYQIAQYCDQLVPDGYGGQEPRMTANLWITDQRSAYEVLSDMASVFRAMVIWNGQQMTATQDRPSDPVCTYTQANVIDGKFSRQFVAQKAIYTACEVEYADKRNMYQKAIEYVADDELIRRYGYNVKKITAFACTSRGQAHRYGKWVLETSRLEQCTITFSVGREGLMHLPGDIIEVADNRYSNTALGGRVVALNSRQITLDRPIEYQADSYLGWLSLSDIARIERAKIQSVSADGLTVTLEREPVGLEPQTNWTLHKAEVHTQLYRAIGIAENADGSFAITALQHEPQKEAIVDNGAHFEPVATSLHSAGLIAPTAPELSTDGSSIALNFNAPANFIGQGLRFVVKLFRNGNVFDVYDDLTEPNLVFNDLPDGNYVAEIRAKNAAGQLSEPTTKTFVVNLAIAELSTVSKVLGIDLHWKNPLFAAPNAAIEIWVSDDNQFDHARKLVTLAYPTNSYSYTGLGAAEEHWFWARMVSKDKAGQFTEPVQGISDRSADKIVDLLQGQITKSALSQALINEINAVTGGENLCPNPSMSESTQHWTGATREQVNGEWLGVVNRRDNWCGQPFSVTAGEQFYFSLLAKNKNATRPISIGLGLSIGNANKSNWLMVSYLQPSAGREWAKIEGYITIPSGFDKAQMFVQINKPASAQGSWYVKNVTFYRVVNTTDGKVSSMHTLKTQAISGGRKAIAGIAIGAETDGRTAESSVIVMADKFAVVKNGQDNQVKPVFTIADNKVALNGDIAVKGDLIGNRFVGGEIDISGQGGVLRVGRTGAFLMRSSLQNRGLLVDSEKIVVYDERGRIRVKMGKLS